MSRPIVLCPLRRRWLSYSLRSLLTVITVVAIGLAWVAKERGQSQRESQIAIRLTDHGATVEFAGLFDALRDANATNPPEGQSWWRSVLSDLVGPRVVAVSERTARLTDLSPVAELHNSKSLKLDEHHYDFGILPQVRVKVRDLTPLAGLEKLERLELYVPVRDLAPLAGLKGLQHLEINHIDVHDKDRIRDISAIGGLENLRHVALLGTRVHDISGFTGLKNLECIEIRGSEVSDLSPLANLEKLHELDLEYAHVRDLSPLAGLKNLKRLNLESTEVTDLSPLVGLENLQTLEIASTEVSKSRTKVSNEQVKLLQRALPACKILY